MTTEWLAGFCEGEACFGYYHSKRRKVARWQPTFAITQNDSEVMKKVQVFLTSHGIRSTIVRFDYGKNKLGSVQLRIGNYAGCFKLYHLIRPHMEHPGKIAQIDRWLGTFKHGTTYDPRVA